MNKIWDSTKFTIKVLGIYVIVNLSISMVVGGAIIGAMGFNNYQYALAPVSFFSGIITIVVFILVLKSRTKRGFKGVAQRLDIKKIDKRSIGVVIVYYFICLFISEGLVQNISPYFESYIEVSNMFAFMEKSTLGIISIAILAPILEEIMCRGLLFKRYLKNHRLGSALVVQAIIFGFLHGNVVQAVYAGVMGIALGLVYLYSKSLLAPILLHFINNALSCIIPENMIPSGLILNVLMVVSFIIFITISIKIVKKYKVDFRKI